MEFNISSEIMAIHFEHFDHSLKKFPDKYLPLFFAEGSIIPLHFGYVCPLCLTNCFMVDKDGVLHYTSDFSLDHFPPESCGGKLKILVCKKCNSEAGHLYDFSLKEKLEHVSFNKKIPLSTITAKSEITDVQGWYHSAMTIREDGETEISFKPNPKKKLPPLDNWIEESKNNFDWKANLTFGIPDNEKVSKALLKAAYLYCFMNWGYEFIYSANGDFFRKVLKDETKYPVTVPTFWLDHETQLPEGAIMPKGLCFIQKPYNWQSLIVNLSLTLKETGYNCTVPILIPNPADTEFKKLVDVQKEIENNFNQEVSFVPLKNFLQEKIYDAYTQTWASVMHEFGSPK